jgi:hypothetical protein
MSGQLLQTLLNQEFGRRLVCDGVVGPKTLADLDKLNPGEYNLLELMLSMKGVNMAATLTGDRNFRIPKYNYLTAQKCNELVEKACKLVGFSSDYAPVFQDFLRMEATQREENGVPCYYVLSRSPAGARGLMQMQLGAWIDARKVALDLDKPLDIGEYEQNVYFPGNNIVGGLAYALIGVKLLREAGMPVNRETLYLCHNQGPYIWERDKYGKFRGPKAKYLVGQSREARMLAKKYFG